MARRIAALLDRAAEEGRSQGEIAAELNKSRTALSEWKAGRAEPDLDTFKRLCKLLEVSADDVLGLAAPAGMRRREVADLAAHLDRAREVAAEFLARQSPNRRAAAGEERTGKAITRAKRGGSAE